MFTSMKLEFRLEKCAEISDYDLEEETKKYVKNQGNSFEMILGGKGKRDDQYNLHKLGKNERVHFWRKGVNIFNFKICSMIHD